MTKRHGGVVAAGALLAWGWGCSDALPPFSTAVTYTVDPNPQSSAIVDMNGDGKADVVVSTTSALDVLLGDGNGALGAKAQAVGAGGLYGLAVADFDGDGHPDLASSEPTGGNVEVFVNTAGTGTFAAPIVSPAGAACSPRSLVAADFNGDGKQDVAVLCDQSTTLSVLLGSGAGGFGAPLQTTVGTRAAVAIVTADLNRDGRPDLVVGTFGTDSVGEIVFLLGKGNGTFGPPAALPLAGRPTLALGDLNADGLLDVVARFGTSCQVVLQDAQGSFSSGVMFTYGRDFDPNSLLLVDLDGDKLLDLAATNPATGDISIAKGVGAGGFGAEQLVPAGSTPTALSAGDLNGDGKPDLVAADGSGDKLYVLFAR